MNPEPAIPAATDAQRDVGAENALLHYMVGFRKGAGGSAFQEAMWDHEEFRAGHAAGRQASALAYREASVRYGAELSPLRNDGGTKGETPVAVMPTTVHEVIPSGDEGVAGPTAQPGPLFAHERDAREIADRDALYMRGNRSGGHETRVRRVYASAQEFRADERQGDTRTLAQRIFTTNILALLALAAGFALIGVMAWVVSLLVKWLAS